MAEVKWIKIVTGIFDDEKIQLIEQMPDSDTILVIWFKLLCLAGKTNNHGIIMLSDKIPYTDEMLATVFRRPLNTVRLALKTFETYGMIEIVDGIVTISNWEKHQNEDKLQFIREYNRLAKQKEREQKKQLCQGHVNDSQDTDIDIEVDKDITPPIAPQGDDEDFQGESLPVQTAAGTEKSADHSKTLDLFNRFWKAYPKKVGKGAAERSFKKYKPDTELLDSMLKALEIQRRSDQWNRDGGQYIPNPATWLNQKRWEDEPPSGRKDDFLP